MGQALSRMSSAQQGGTQWLPMFLIFSTGVTLLEQYLEYRQLKRDYEKKIPKELKGIISEERFHKAQAYNAEKRVFGMYKSLFDFGLQTVYLVFFVYPWMWSLSGRCFGTNEYAQSLGFWLFHTVIMELIGTPWSLYYDFVIEERHGFNKKTMALFWMDKLKSNAIAAVIGPPIICAIIWIVHKGGKKMFLWLWGFTMCISLAALFIYPNLIAPLFNKYEALKDDKLRKEIEDLASGLKFPLGKLYQVDGSKRSSHSNAYMYGFWFEKRIVLFDTLLNLSHDKILAILAHELGHWKHGHTLQMMLQGFAHQFVIFYIYSAVAWNEGLFRSFGFNDKSVLIGLTLFSLIFSPVNEVISLLQTLLSRVYEFQADRFSASLGYGDSLKGGLKEISEQNLSCFNPDPWYAWYHYSHPPLVERLRGIEKYQATTTTSCSSEGDDQPGRTEAATEAEKEPLLAAATGGKDKEL